LSRSLDELKQAVQIAYHEADQYFTHLTAYDFASMEPYFIAITKANMMASFGKDPEAIEAQLAEAEAAKQNIVQIAAPESVCIYFWGEQMPSTLKTPYTVNNDNYRDDPGFRPFMMRYPVPEGISVKGAMLVGSGGGRNTMQEGHYYADFFSKKGYECFVLCYRLAPYGNMDAAADVQRAIRVVRSMADELGYPKDHIALIGNSGSSVCSTFVNNYFYGDIQPTIIDPGYVPDEIDAIDSTVNAQLHTALVPWELKNPNYPPSFWIIGCDDPNFKDAYLMADIFTKYHIPVELHTFMDVPHAFLMGRDTVMGQVYDNIKDWGELAVEWLDRAFVMKRTPMQWKPWSDFKRGQGNPFAGGNPFRIAE